MTVFYLIVGSLVIIVALVTFMRIMVWGYTGGQETMHIHFSCALWVATLLYALTIVGATIFVTRLLYGG